MHNFLMGLIKIRIDGSKAVDTFRYFIPHRAIKGKPKNENSAVIKIYYPEAIIILWGSHELLLALVRLSKKVHRGRSRYT